MRTVLVFLSPREISKVGCKWDEARSFGVKVGWNGISLSLIVCFVAGHQVRCPPSLQAVALLCEMSSLSTIYLFPEQVCVAFPPRFGDFRDILRCLLYPQF